MPDMADAVPTKRDWTARTIEDDVSDAFVFFRGLSLDGWDAWLDARDRGNEEPRWDDLDAWESLSIYEVTVINGLGAPTKEEGLRGSRIAWRFCRPTRGRPWDRRIAGIQERAIRIAGEDPSDPLRDPSFFAPR